MKIFVTGGNGFIGSVVVPMLLEQGHEVRCLLRETSDVARIEGLAYEPVRGDIREQASLREGMIGCEAVIHLACLSSWDLIDSPLMDEITEGGTANVLAAADGRKIVYVSSAVAVNGSADPVVYDEGATFTLTDPKLRYAHAKVRAEALCLKAAAAGAPVVVVNPAEVYGPHDTQLVTAGNLIDFADGSPALVCAGGTAVAHVDDVAFGIVRALERGRSGERYLLSGENQTFRQLAELTLTLLERKPRVLQLPNWLIRALTAVGTTLHIPLPYNPRAIPYATRYWFFDNAKAKTELGVEFRSARESLLPTVQWLVKAGLIR